MFEGSCGPSHDQARQTHSIGYTVGKSHELDLIVGALPVGVEGQYQPQGGGMRVRVVVRQGDMSEGREGTAVGTVCGAHIGYEGAIGFLGAGQPGSVFKVALDRMGPEDRRQKQAQYKPQKTLWIVISIHKPKA